MYALCSLHQVCVHWQPAAPHSAADSNSNSNSNSTAESSKCNADSVQVMLHIAVQLPADRADGYESERYKSGSYRSIMPVLSLPITVHRKQPVAVCQSSSLLHVLDTFCCSLNSSHFCVHSCTVVTEQFKCYV